MNFVTFKKLYFMNQSKDNYQSVGIKSWAEEDRPREKLIDKGRHILSEAELIAILIGSGNKKETAVELSKRILANVGNNLNELGKLSVTDLCHFKGIGKAKAVSIIAALELGRRRKETEFVKKEKLVTSKDVYQIMRSFLLDLPHEEFWLLMLSRSNSLIRKELISRGGIAGTVVDIKIIFKAAVTHYASSIIICHNHPSGNLKPSEADIKITNAIKAAGKIMDIPLLDHLIITEESFYSFADEGMLA
jgi:DNA repair protein RadC